MTMLCAFVHVKLVRIYTLSVAEAGIIHLGSMSQVMKSAAFMMFTSDLTFHFTAAQVTVLQPASEERILTAHITTAEEVATAVSF